MKLGNPIVRFVFVVGVVTLVPPANVTVHGDEPRKERTASRGLLFNEAADGLCVCVPFDAPIDEKATKEMILEGYRKLIDRYADTQITHLLLNMNYQRACYPSKVWNSYWDVENPETDVTGWPRAMWLIHKKGIDPYAVCIRLCRDKKISPWASMRMNDTHYIDEPNKANTFWKDHPEYRSSPTPGFNFAIRAVRDHHLALVGEILDRYDVDGLELDWMRFCHHFRPGEGRDGCEILTGFMREVRRLANKASGRHGHPIKIAARVPAVPKFGRELGMDGVTWVREGLVDILIASSTWMPADRDIPLETWRKLIGPVKHDYTLAASMGLWVRCAPGGVAMRNDLESARGFTAAMLHRTADQIYVFNHFNFADFNYTVESSDGGHEQRNVFRQLVSEAASLETVLGKPRRHPLTFHDTAPPNADNPKPLPASLEQDKPAEFRIYIGPKPSTGRVVIRAGLDKTPDVTRVLLAVRLNGAACRPIADLNKPGQFVPHTGSGFHIVWSVEQVAPRVAQFEAVLAAVKEGYNLVALSVEKGSRQKLTWLEIYLIP